MFKSLSKPGTAGEAVSGKAGGDSLLKELQSSPLDVWRVLRILFEHPHPGIQEYVCNRLPELGEAIVERYLLQLVYLAVSKPGQHLERVILLLCARSFRVAIKTQWLLVALCQDHPKSRALEAFRDQAYKAALEGKWEVPIRSAKLDPLSPNNSAQFSPPFCSPTNSYMATHLATVSQFGREMPPQCVAIQPPGSMVMSPPGASSSSAGFGAAVRQAGDGGAPAALHRRGGAMPALACLLPPEQRNSGAGSVAASTADSSSGTAVAQQLLQQQRHSTDADAAAGSPAWLDENGVSALAPAIRTSPPVASHGAGGPAASGDTFADGSGATAAPAPATILPVASSGRPAPAAAPVPVASASVVAHPSATGVRHTGAPAPGTSTSAFSNGVGANIAERIQALRRELGEGEGVSALLERAKQQGMATVAAPDDDPLLSDDELSNRPMSPLSRLRFDTFGATLDFVDALCDASSSLTNYSQEERQRALRAGLDHINGEIEKANRREVAIWFPMGRRGDRVLGIAAQEAVLLNSREKAPFMLFVEVLEGQNECGDESVGADAFVDLTSPTGVDVKARLEALSCNGRAVGGGGLSASMMAANPGLKLEFGRRETYGIALTGIGAQHQLQYMHSAPGGPATLLKPAEVQAGRQQQDHGSELKQRQVESSTANGRTDLLAQSGTAAGFAPIAAAPAGPGATPSPPPPPRAQIVNEAPVLVSPTPTRVASMTQASLLEEHAAALARRGAAAATSSSSEAAAAAAGDGSMRSAGAASPAPPAAPASEVFIPTRSASSNNIAAAAAAALAAGASGGGSDSILSASARSSEAGAAGTGICAGAPIGGSCGSGGGNGALPQTPRSGLSLTGLPPRPPSSSSSSTQQQLPIGGISPINAAKEVSSSSGGAEGGGLLSSNLLRRILGDRAEAAGNEGQAAGSSDLSRFFTIASAAGSPSAPSSLAPQSVCPNPTIKPAQAGEPGLTVPVAAPRHAAAPPRFSGAHLMGGKLHELAALGVFGPHSQGKSDPEVMEVLSNISASLRGEQPMVRVKILPVGPGDASRVGTGAAAAASSSFAGLGRVKAALLSQQPQAVPDDAAEGGQNKAMALLSRLGLRRKAAAEDEVAEAAGAAVAGVPSADNASAALPAAAACGATASVGAAAQVTIPVASGGSSTGKQQRSSGGGGGTEAQQQLVRLVIILPTQSLNLDIKSPHRKSRRMPSCEAIEMMADKYKVYTLPPPPEFGPPLGPGPDGSSGFMDRVVERASDEGEAAVEEATPAVPKQPAEALAWELARGVQATAEGERAVERPPTAAAAPRPPRPPAIVAEVASAAAVTAVLGPPLPPEWESRSPRAVRPQTADAAPPPLRAAHQPAPEKRSGGGGVSGSWLVSPPTAVAEATAPADAAAATALNGALSGDSSDCRPVGPSERWAPSLDKSMEAGSVASAGATSSTASSSSGLAASLQSSLTRILNRATQQPSAQSAPECAAAGATIGTTDQIPAGELLATAAAPGPSAPPPTKPSLLEAVWGESSARAPPSPPQVQQRSGVPSMVEAGASAASASSGLAASLQSSLTRILNRTAAGQQPSVSEAATSAGSGSSGGSSLTGVPRGGSPVRGSAGSSGGASQPTASATAPEPQGAEADGRQRHGGAATLEGAPGPSAPAAAGLAASLQSSLTRILSRSSQPPAEGSSSAFASSGGGNPPGHSPVRGVSPVRGGVSPAGAAGGQQQAVGDATQPAASSSTGTRLSKLLSRLQQDQQPPPPPQPPSSPQQAPAAQQPQRQPPPPSPQFQQQQARRHQPSPGRPVAMPPGRYSNGLASEMAASEMAAAARPLPYGLPKVTDGRYERESLEERRRREAHSVYGERWVGKVKRIQRESPHGRRKGWALRCVIVKSGDDCRQELLALQLVRTFGDIFLEAGLPLWVRYYEVLVTSNKTALIEMVPNTLSIHTIKSRSPSGTSLSDHFFAKFGRSGTPECTAAQRRFTESLAAYSLICYLLQIKDRHNGNILIDDDGRVVHIDYGFLLSNSPGGVNFESAPFKLTRELLEVMDSNSDGRPSEMFDYFKVLVIQGFIAVRHHSDRILLLVKLMAKSGFPCFKGGERALKALEKRLMASLSEVQCVEHVLQLIAESLDAWRTRQYDYYQRVLNGIL
ncbi:hypothetical protein PLESTB_000163400 [Pleodorina starrii]|uniref:1-phosphatidylinositol 4-kinase n=1 Tax=Pleodorina starrii TaxID=330485 RepID=A0A9W6BBX6_9CHLO|nr:hypothetical protein PLESTB_000163400 [Pleodorina starrii]